MLFRDRVSRVQMTRSVEGRLGPLVFLQIRNNSDRCWKAQEHLNFKRKCSWEWQLCGGHMVGSGNKRCGIVWEEVFKNEK